MAQSSLEKVELKKTFGLFTACVITFGTIIGSGIFITPKGVLMNAGSPGISLIVWALAGILCVLGSLSLIELGTIMPRAGGIYIYTKEAYGDMTAFLMLWARVVINLPVGNAIMALTFGNYVLQVLYPDCEPPKSAANLLAICALTTLTYINCAGVTYAARVQGAFVLIKMLSLFLLTAAGVAFWIRGEYGYLQHGFDIHTSPSRKIALSFYSAVFAYGGWTELNCLMEELKNPYRNLTLAMIITIPLTTLIYVMANATYLTLLSPEQIIESDGVAVTFSLQVFGGIGWIACFLVACSTFGSLNGSLLCTGRLCFAGAREGHLPAVLSLINITRFTPYPAMMIQGLLSCIMLLSADVYSLINMTAIVSVLYSFAGVTTLLVFRRTKPNVHRPFKVPLIVPIVFLVAWLFILAISIYTSPRETGMGLCLLASGIPCYCVGILWKKKPATYRNTTEHFIKTVQKITLSCKEEH